MEDLDLKVKEALEKIGFQVDRIPRGAGNSADFRIEVDGISSIIEVKTMNDSSADWEAYFSKLKSGIPFPHESKKDTRKNIKKASVQVDASYANLNTNGFKGIGIYSNAINSTVDIEMRFRDFYGICEFFCINGVKVSFVKCYGFYKSIFDLYSNIDFAVLMSDHRKLFLINTLSPQYSTLLTSKTLDMFEKSREWSIYGKKDCANQHSEIYLNNRELAVGNPGNIHGAELQRHENCPHVIAAKNELCRLHGYSDMVMESNRGGAFVVGG